MAHRSTCYLCGIPHKALPAKPAEVTPVDLPSALITLADLKALMAGLGVKEWTVTQVGMMHDQLMVPQHQLELVSAHVNYRRCVGHAIDVVGKVES